MSDPKLISPMLDGFVMGDPISDHAGVRCCPAMKNNSDERYIVKIISNPASQQRLDALLLTGAYPDAESAKSYFKTLADEVVTEIKALNTMADSEGFLPVEDYQVVPMENGETGYDVYILTQYRRTLEKQFRSAPMTHLGAVNLGLDICSALSVCRRAGYLFVDLKPSNIHIVNGNEYRIADLGFVKLDSLKYASLPDKYRSPYTAPEIADAFASINTSMDVYALGLIIYRAYNGGELPFSGDQAPAIKFDPPAYADYEMAEIILKACDPDPNQRWENPEQMGQALVSYMQRNGANDTPIVPPVINQPETPVESAVSEEAEANIREDITDEQLPNCTESEVIIPADSPIVILNNDVSDTADPIEDTTTIDEPDTDATEIIHEISYNEDYDGNLSFLPDESDETTQELSADEIEYEEVSDEVSAMLSQVDEIAEYQVPDPVVAPEPVDISSLEPAPIETVEAIEDKIPAETEADSADLTEEESNNTVDQEQSGDTLDEAITEQSEDVIENISDEDISESIDEIAEEDGDKSKTKKHILLYVILGLLGASIITAGFLFFKLYFLQEIVAMDVTGTETSVSVNLVTDIDDSKLLAVCTDAYGTKSTKPIANGKAEFSNLLGGTEYTITIEISGFHKLTGEYKKSYYTPILTNIVQLEAVVGPENGSALITFAPDGPDASEWQVSCSAEGEETKTHTFTGHTATVKGLTIGKTYEITLTSADKLFLSGETTILFTAKELVYPENLIISSFRDGSMAVTWSAPEGITNMEWTVRCYNANGYNEMKTTDQTSITFENIDTTQDYTVEVSAEGQSVSERTTVEENSIVLENMNCSINNNGQIALTWNCAQQIPQDGWDVTCTIRDTEIVKKYNTETNNITIKNTVPGYTYDIEIKAANDAPVICPPIVCNSGEARIFSCTYAGATITGKDITLSMCKTPDKANWTRRDLKKDDYTTTFKVGEKASFVIRARKLYGLSDDEMVVTYVIYNAEDQLISIQNENLTWNTMWDYYYGELNIPFLPEDPGNYKVVVYYNSGLVGEQDFTVTA